MKKFTNHWDAMTIRFLATTIILATSILGLSVIYSVVKYLFF